MKVCKIDSCCREARSRSMCNSHYTMWRRKFVEEVGPLQPDCMTAEVLEALPASISDAASKSGTCYRTANKAIMRSKKARKVYVMTWESPSERDGGRRWVPIYAQGSKPDAVVTEQMKREHRLARRRSLHIIVRARKAPNSWLGALL